MANEDVPDRRLEHEAATGEADGLSRVGSGLIWYSYRAVAFVALVYVTDFITTGLEWKMLSPAWKWVVAGVALSSWLSAALSLAFVRPSRRGWRCLATSTAMLLIMACTPRVTHN